MKLSISKEFRFEASHVLPLHPGACSRLHGHSWVLKVTVDGEVDRETGFVVDFGELRACVMGNVIDLVDHQHLGQGLVLMRGEEDLQDAVFEEDFYPSSENLVMKFVEILREPIRDLGEGVELLAVELQETCTSAARWQRQEGKY